MTKKKRCFVPIECWPFASPDLFFEGKKTDIGLLAEALVLFENVTLNIQTPASLADLLESFRSQFGDLSFLFELFQDRVIVIHFFDFMSAPIEKNGVYSYWNIQDELAQRSHLNSFQHKILYAREINDAVPKARHREKLYNLVSDFAIIDESEKYGPAIEAARASINKPQDLEALLNSFLDELPSEKRKFFPPTIKVSARDLGEGKIQHQFNIDFTEINRIMPGKGFGMHLPGAGLIHSHRIVYASRLHNYDVYLPNPISVSVIGLMTGLTYENKRFKQTVTDLREEDNFPDIRGAFNRGDLTWKDIIEIRKKAERFRQWFLVDGGNPKVAARTYGEEFKSSTGIQKYRDKAFAIASVIGTAMGAAAEQAITGGVSIAGPVLGSLVSNTVPLAKDLFNASEEEGWQPRFFGNWLKLQIEAIKREKE